MKNIFRLQKKQFSTLALGCALIASTALALVNCTDPAAPAKYTVTFDTNGGKPAVADKTVEDGKLLTKPATEPSKEGFSFVGWYKDRALTQAFNFTSDKITANITLYAKWIEAHTVTFNSNGGTDVDQQSIESGKKASKPNDPTKTDSTFAGWYKDRALTQVFNFSSEKITANITLYAKWIEAYTVTFNANGGTNADPQTVESNKKASKPSDPTKEGHTFVGWYKDQALTQAFNFSTEKITANITLYAKWTINSYSVSFNPNNGEVLPPVLVAYGGTVARPKTLTKTYHTFLGWYKDKAFTQAFDFDTETISGSITLYAKWKSNLVDIPDVNFRNKLKALIPGAFKGELLNTKSTDVTGLTTLGVIFSFIKSLEGIQYFTGLTSLNCSRNELTDLDVSNNTALTTLSCAYNRLTHLDMRGMRNVNSLSIQAASNATNVIKTLKVHENLKDHAQISAVKTARGDKVKIATYSAAAGSTVYTAVCNDYDPTETDEQDRCKDTP